MKNKTMVKIENDYRLQFIINSAFRYAIGRTSYAVNLIQNWIKDNQNILEEYTIDCMIRDLNEIMLRCQRMNDYRELGKNIDKKNWEYFLKYLLHLKEKKCHTFQTRIKKENNSARF